MEDSATAMTSTALSPASSRTLTLTLTLIHCTVPRLVAVPQHPPRRNQLPYPTPRCGMLGSGAKGDPVVGDGPVSQHGVADNGDMYSWGRGQEGQLGHEDRTKVEP